jgi:hypothetical protein
MAAEVSRRVTVTETRPATLFGCTWAVIPGRDFPAALDFGFPRSPWYALRLTADRRFISGFACPDEASARRRVADDRAVLLDAETDHFERTGELPAPMTPILVDAPVIA